MATKPRYCQACARLRARLFALASITPRHLSSSGLLPTLLIARSPPARQMLDAKGPHPGAMPVPVACSSRLEPALPNYLIRLGPGPVLEPASYTHASFCSVPSTESLSPAARMGCVAAPAVVIGESGGWNWDSLQGASCVQHAIPRAVGAWERRGGRVRVWYTVAARPQANRTGKEREASHRRHLQSPHRDFWLMKGLGI